MTETTDTDSDDIIVLAQDDFEIAKKGWSDIYDKARDDLYFLSDQPFAQWDAQEAQSRSSVGRPVITMDQLTQFIHQVSNDIRMNTPTINIIPDDDAADMETAEVLQGIIKGIEYKSKADAAYDTASDFAVKSSIGFIRVDHDYSSAEGFDQELKICRVVNPQSIYIDPNSTEPDGSDAMYGFVLEEMSVKAFKRQWPKANPVSFGDVKVSQARTDQDKITVAEYFRIIDDSEEYGLTETGDVQKKTADGVYKSVRKQTKRKVMRYKLAGQDVLERTTFPGIYIPIVPVYGEEAWVEGKRNLFSLIRKSKEGQMMYNLWKSLETELLLKQQQAPVMAANGQLTGFEADWKNPEKAMALLYNQTDVDGNPAPAPQRLAQPQIPTGVVNAARETVDDIKATMGLYNASIGERSNETSGVAIQRRQKEGDVATFHFGDNLVRSVTQVGKIIINARSVIYDTPRKVTMVDKEDNAKMIGINGERTDSQDRDFHIKEGGYDVRVVTGPSFTTQRQEAAEYYNQIITAQPELMPIIGDLVFKYQDAPGAQAISARLKKLVALKTPELLTDEEKEDDQPDPQVVALTQQLQQLAQQAQMEIQQLQAQLADKQGEMQLKAQELQIKQGDQQLKAQEIQSKTVLEAKKLEIDEQKLMLDAQNASREPEATPMQQQQPTGIKLDTTGFQYSKTPEQLAMEESDMMSKQQNEAAEMQLKMQQTQAVIEALNGISMQVAQLTETTALNAQQTAALTQVASQPIVIQRDENGMIVGAV